ncbi:hypothetical protein PTKIN_Ptkin02bG0057800 [Pterospermum kingtungense]
MRKPCCDKQDTNKGAWSKEEDEKLINYIRKHGEGCWRTLPQAAGLLRCGKSCRLRWINYLRPDLKRGNFAEDEEDLIIKLHALLGNRYKIYTTPVIMRQMKFLSRKNNTRNCPSTLCLVHFYIYTNGNVFRWSLIAGRLPGRTDNEVKNYWNSHLRKKLINMGIDPANHRLMSHSLLRCRPENPHTSNSSASATSFGSKVPADHRSQSDDNDQVSDTASCLEDEPCSELPDLNLDLSLTVSTISPLSVATLEDEENKPHKQFNISRDLDLSPSPTLVLFR